MAKVKVDLKKVKVKMDKFKKQAFVAMGETYQKRIISEIEQGRSPVAGKGRYKKYSSSYLKQIKSGAIAGKTARPVNLKVTGKLHKSLFVKVSANKLLIGFKDKLADIHNRQGAGKSKTIRRMLPTKTGETFSQSIQNDIEVVLKRIAKRIFG